MNKGLIWTGRVLSTLVVLPMLMGIVMSFSGKPEVAEGMVKMGFPAALLKTIVTLEILSVLLYAIPATSVVGAILLTGYMGGAICTHLRLGEPVILQTALPIIAWLGLWLREPRLKALLPLRR